MAKILAAMSGGVDSSVAALLLHEAGHQVVGTMLRLFDARAYGVEAPSRTCCSITDIEDARGAALKIGIPFHVLNYSGLFQEQVIDRFARAYATGATPNPCLDCNRYVKFDALLERASGMGFDGIATGHYAQVEQDAATGRYLLKKGADPGKDQSYVLYTLTQSQLTRLWLPLGGLPKQAVRHQADAAGLHNAAKPDSQDICFVPDGDYAGFLARECGLENAPGDFVNKAGQRLGTHRGIAHYTVGQRRGLGIPATEPLYVAEIDAGNNRVVLTGAEGLLARRFVVDDLNWIALEAPTSPLRAAVRTRYHQPEAKATLHPNPDGSLVVEYDEPHRRPAPGQAAVFYDGDRVLGGGVITKRPV